MSSFISNEEIRQIYIENQNSGSDEWRNLVFDRTRFFIFKKIKKNFYLQNDLKQEALLGLWSAIITFDFNKNFDFFRWADWHIKTKIRDHIWAEERQRDIKNSIKISNLDTHILESNEYAQEKKHIKIDFLKWLKEGEKKLSKRDLKIIVGTVLLDKTLAEVAEANNISKERARQIKELNLQEIRNFIID
jgi:RNA polymerase sigma factor (sigma-70 family)